MEIHLFNDVALIKEFIDERYALRYNILSCQVEMNGKPMTDRDRNDICLSARSKFPDITGIKTIINEVIESNCITEFNPVEDFLANLPEWDGQDHVGSLLDRIPGITASQRLWVRTWLRGVVSQWKDDDRFYGNQCVLTLIGDQNCRKSTFFKMLLPETLRPYYLDNFNLSNSFSRDMTLTNNLLVNIDEMDQIKESQQASLKYNISRPAVNGRPIYGRTQVNRKRFASFTATTNCPHPLNDVTGSRRFLCIQIPKGKIIDTLTPIDYAQLYAQIVDELDNQHLLSWFTDDEVKEIQTFNLKFQATSDLSAMLETCFRKPEDSNAGTQVTIKEITNTIKSQYPNVAKAKGLDVSIGIMLTQQGYEKKHTKKGNTYNVMRLVA